jgi:hypothetical protein
LACSRVWIPRKRISIDQAVLQGAEEPLDAALGLRAVRGDPFDAQLVQRAAELGPRGLTVQLLLPLHRTGSDKQAVFVGVQSQGPAVALQPAAQRAQVLFAGILLGKTGPDAAGGVIDQGDQLQARSAIFQPAEGGTVHHHQFAEDGATLAPDMDRPHSAAPGAPQAGRTHPPTQCFAADLYPAAGQMLGRQCGTKVGVAASHFGQHAALHLPGDFPVRRPPAQPVDHSHIAFQGNTPLQSPHLAGA